MAALQLQGHFFVRSMDFSLETGELHRYVDFRIWRTIRRYVDKARRREQKENPALKHSRYLWLRNPGNLKPSQQSALAVLTKMNLKTARAYRLKRALQDVYSMAPDRESGEAMLRK